MQTLLGLSKVLFPVLFVCLYHIRRFRLDFSGMELFYWFFYPPISFFLIRNVQQIGTGRVINSTVFNCNNACSTLSFEDHAALNTWLGKQCSIVLDLTRNIFLSLYFLLVPNYLTCGHCYRPIYILGRSRSYIITHV